ncbi:MAG: type II secretion system protein GspJ [Pirellulales bacterium]
MIVAQRFIAGSANQAYLLSPGGTAETEAYRSASVVPPGLGFQDERDPSSKLLGYCRKPRGSRSAKLEQGTYPAAHGRPRAGFTLLEMLLASALATVMLLTLWSLLNMYMRLFTQAPAAVEQSQLVRAVVQQIAHDLRCVIPPIDRPERPLRLAGGSATRDGSANGSISTSTVVPASDLPLGSLGSQSVTSKPSSGLRSASLDGAVGILPPASLIGEPNSLRMEVLEIAPRPIVGEAEVDERATGERATVSKVPALRHVHYELIEDVESTGDRRGETEGILVRRQRAWDEPADRKETDPAALSSLRSGGLSRVENNDRLDTLPSKYSEDDRSLETDPATFVIPEVSGITFRYCDGSNWSEWWDSRQRGGLPIAVEVVLTLASGRTSERSDASSAVRDPAPTTGDRLAESETVGRTSTANARDDAIDPNSRRFVVRLPAAVRNARADNSLASPVGRERGVVPFSSDQETLP